MLAELLGSTNKERVLVFLLARDKAYATEIAQFWTTGLTPVRNALDKLELAGVLTSETAGRARLYQFNPRYPLRDELAAMLEKTLSLYPVEMRDALLNVRKRPRRKGKSL